MNERMKPGMDAPYNMAESVVLDPSPCNGEVPSRWRVFVPCAPLTTPGPK